MKIPKPFIVFQTFINSYTAKIPKDFLILLIVFGVIFGAFALKDLLDFRDMPPLTNDRSDVYGFYEPKILLKAVERYRKINDTSSNADNYANIKYQVPSRTNISLDINNIVSVDDETAMAKIEGTIFATWDENSLQDFEANNNQSHSKAKTNIFSALSLNFANQEDQLLKRIWLSSYKDDDGITQFRDLQEFKGIFKVQQDYRKFPFDKSEIKIELSSGIYAPDIHLQSVVEESSNKDPEWRIDSYFYEKNDCVYPKEWKMGKEYYGPQFMCTEDEFDYSAEGENLSDFIDNKTIADDSVSSLLLSSPIVRFTSYLKRAPGSSFFRYIAPIMFVILVASIFDQLDDEAWEIKMAIPPTILLTLIFMHNGFRAEIPQISYVTFMDRIYFLSYASCILLLFSTILSRKGQQKEAFQQNDSVAKARSISINRRLTLAVRVSFLLTVIVGPFLAYYFS